MNANDNPADLDSNPVGTSRLMQLGIGVLVLILGVGVTAGMVASRSAEEQTVPEEQSTLVEVIAVSLGEATARVESTGVVAAAQEVSMVPQVSGALTMVSDQLLPGGRFAKGALLARIDSRDYQLAADQERERLQQAEVSLALEQGRQETARREWVLLGNEGEPPDLAARKPQLRSAELALETARSGLKRAELALSRTAIRAPFNAMVLNESADIGQVVGAAPIATLVGTDRFWVNVSVPVEQLSALDIPGVRGERGSKAAIIQQLGVEQLTRSGEVLRLAGQLDPQSRTATLIVAVDDPLNLQAGTNPGLPMLPGAFVDVVIEGRAMPQTITVPRVALQDGDHVWVSQDGRLARRDVTVGWRNGDSIVLTGGLEAGEQVITTSLSFPIEGMSVQPQTRAVVKGE
ncbi:MAG: efflux RND transporter periplasmic adaptor subunit [Myxococcota bacterium]|nr:efflux RND transporter periplasmic adaptor subunit [Myxococcota bacterium]